MRSGPRSCQLKYLVPNPKKELDGTETWMEMKTNDAEAESSWTGLSMST